MSLYLTQPKLTDAEGLLSVLFDEGSRPSTRWLRSQTKRRAIPFVKIGRLVRFDPDQVRAALDKNQTVRVAGKGSQK